MSSVDTQVYSVLLCFIRADVNVVKGTKGDSRVQSVFVGFYDTYAGDFGPFITSGSPCTVARLVCPKHWNPDKQVMYSALAPPQASPPLQLRLKIDG